MAEEKFLNSKWSERDGKAAMHIFPKSQRGAALVEYVVLIALIAIISIGSVHRLGTEINESFHQTAVILDESMSAAVRPSSGGDGGVNGSGGYTISPVYAEACSTGAGYIRAEGGEIVDPSNDGEWTHGLRVFTERFYVNIYFNSPNEQEYYGAYAGMDRFDQHRYGQTAIYPPGWNPCIDDQGYPPPNPA